MYNTCESDNSNCEIKSVHCDRFHNLESRVCVVASQNVVICHVVVHCGIFTFAKVQNNSSLNVSFLLCGVHSADRPAVTLQNMKDPDVHMLTSVKNGN